MMGMQGWKDLMEDVQQMLDATNVLDAASTLEQLFLKKGEVGQMKWLLTLKETSERAYDDLKDEK
jgi:hypothetical protein